MPVSALSELYVLVVDDTVVYRRILQKVVDEIANAKVVGVAANGRIALERLDALEVDIVLLDVEMPEMDGIEALQEIRRRWPGIGVVLFSGADKRSADLTMRALELGALDFVPKADTGDVGRNHRQLVQQLEVIFRGFERRRLLNEACARTSVKPGAGGPSLHSESVGASVGKVSECVRRTGAIVGIQADGMATAGHARLSSGQQRAAASLGPLRDGSIAEPSAGRYSNIAVEALLIGCSTGGPQALAKVIPQLPADLGVPVFVVQHMPPIFTASLAETLNRASRMPVCGATAGQLVQANRVFIAPGGRHMAVLGERGQGQRFIVLTDEPPVNSCRPSVDVLFRSALAVYAGATLSVVLTGMGEDGLDGVRALRDAGGRTLTQSEDSCVVYGMPRAIDVAGYSDESVGLNDMATQIVAWLRRGGSRQKRE